MYCPSCGKPTDANVRFCPTCGAQVSAGFASAPTGPAYVQRKLVRPRFPRMIGGVCSAFALQFGWDVTLVRVLTAAVAVLTSGVVGLAYLAAWVIIPEAPYELPAGVATYEPGYGTGVPPTPPPPPTGSATV